jgi:glycosyltransferase involved in cell wall biosynthesis
VSSDKGKNAPLLRVVIATGPGKLHFLESAAAIAKAGAEVNLLTGWVPSPRQERLADLVGTAIGEEQLSRRLIVRRLKGERITVTANGWTEAVGAAAGFAGRLPFADEDFTSALAFRIHGLRSIRHLKSADILLVRSGAGRGGAMAAARANGLKIVADHSIAHPSFMKDVLTEEYDRQGMHCDVSPRSAFWRGVLEDCDESDKVLVNSDFVKETFVQNGFSAEKVEVAYWGVRRDFFGLKKDYRRNGPLRLIFTGHFDLRKGVRILLEAVRLVRSRGLDARLQVAGKMGTGKACIKPADAEFLTATPFMPQSELKELLAQSDLFVFPTLAEGCSRSAMEAAAAGLPVVTTRNCGLPGRDGTIARLVPAGDVASLAEAIEGLGENEDACAALGRRAAALISGKFTWDRYGKNVFRFFQGVMGAHDAHRLHN